MEAGDKVHPEYGGPRDTDEFLFRVGDVLGKYID